MKLKTLLLGASVAILGVFILFSLVPQWFAPYSPREMFGAWQGLSVLHPLGTNDMGYDILSELIHATASTLAVGVGAAALSLAIGGLMGLLAGYLGGIWGEAADLVINVFLLVPMLPAAVVVAAFLGAGVGNLILTIGLLSWCGTAKAVRARVRQLREAPFVEALVILGLPRRRILFSHLIKNITELLLTRFIMSVAGCILTEATLSFMGLGDPTRVTWGGMISLAYKRGGFVRGAANWFLAPGLCVVLAVLAFYGISRYWEDRAVVPPAFEQQ